MSNIIIKVENLSKQYRLGEVGTGTLSHDINRWWYKVRGKDDPYLKIGEANDRTLKGGSEYVWALQDINFELRQGEVLGVIGRNGAGKSTLLKVLSRTTTPTTGSVKIKGRVASLLEVGTGFHPELSGRDNIFLNGAILGMSKVEIRKKFDEIVDFAGVERYIDTPVKRYSSGMYVRLAFSVAAYLDPEILIVDEVLAVGDAEFQKKCLGKMKDVSVNEGRTVLFVSHNMAAVHSLCNKGLLMSMGRIVRDDGIDVVLNDYARSGSTGSSSYEAADDHEKPVQILRAAVENAQGVSSNDFIHSEKIAIKFLIKNLSDESGIRCNIACWDLYDKLLFINRVDLKKGMNAFEGLVPGNFLIPGSYKITLAVDIPYIRLIEMISQPLYFDITDLGAEIGRSGDRDNGVVMVDLNLKCLS